MASNPSVEHIGIALMVVGLLIMAGALIGIRCTSDESDNPSTSGWSRCTACFAECFARRNQDPRRWSAGHRGIHDPRLGVAVALCPQAAAIAGSCNPRKEVEY